MSMKSSSSAKATISSYFVGELLAREAGREPAEDDVLAARQLAVEADAERQQRAHAPVDLDAARVRRQDPGHRAHQRRLAGAVGADDAEHLALGHLEGDVLERLDLAHDLLAAAELEHGVLERRRGLERRAVGHRHVLDADRGGSEADSELTLPGDEEQPADDEDPERPRRGRARARHGSGCAAADRARRSTRSAGRRAG